MALATVMMAAPLAGQFTVQPVIMEMRTGTEAMEGTFTVVNEGVDPLQVRIYGADFDQPEAGGHTFSELGSHPRTCADRLALTPGNLLLAAGETGEVRVRVEPGDSACWSLIFVQSVSRTATGIQVAQRIGVKIYGVPAGATLEGEIRATSVTGDPEAGYTVRLAFANLGAAPLRPAGEIEVRSEAGDVVGTVPIPSFSVLPGRTIEIEAPLALDLPAGIYVLVPILDFGGDYLAGGQALLRVGGP